MAVITIVGSGMMGSALAFPARENGNEVRLVGTHLDREIIDACVKTGRHPKFVKDFPEGIKYYQIESLKEAIDGADLVIGGVSSFGVEWFAKTVLPACPDGTVFLTVTKGLMNLPDGKLLTYVEYWEEEAEKIGKRFSFNAIGGPCTSYELVAHDQTEVAFCGRDIEVLKRIREMMRTGYYHISVTTDVVGIESAVALKNGYALGVALTIGVNRRIFGDDSELHYNSQAAIFGQAVREMKKLLDLQGAGSIDNLAVGAGDLYVTVYGGRTRQIGIFLGYGTGIDEAKKILNGVTLESLVVSERVADAIRVKSGRGECREEDFPLLIHVDEILKGAKPDIPWEKFVSE